MNKNESIAISAAIGRAISENAPYIAYSDTDLKHDYEEYTSDEISALTKAGYIDGDFEKFFVISTDLGRKMKWLMRGKTLRVTMARGSDKPHAD